MTKKPQQPPDSPSTAAPAPEAKRTGGAPLGNQNALTHGKRRAKKRTHFVNEDPFDRPARRAISKLKGRFDADDTRFTQLVAIEAGLRRTRSRCDLRGWFDAKGEQKESARQYYDLLKQKTSLLEGLESDRQRELLRGNLCPMCGDKAEPVEVVYTVSLPGLPKFQLPTGGNAVQHEQQQQHIEPPPDSACPVESEAVEATTDTPEDNDAAQANVEPRVEVEVAHNVTDYYDAPPPQPAAPKSLREVINEAGGRARWAGLK